MPSYWVMRTDKGAREFLAAELKDGRLRQGWGYQPDQDLNVMRPLVRDRKELSEDQRRCWRGNRRMLDSEPDGMSVGDIVVVPHLPDRGVWSVAGVVGTYRYEIAAPQHDYGHILPVEMLTRRPVNPYEESVSGRLRQTMRNQLRLWNIDTLGPDVRRVIDEISAGAKGEHLLERLPKILEGLEVAAWRELTEHYHGAEFEKPCVLLLKSMYGDENVEHKGGAGERGADAICAHIDPLGVEHRIAVQIKMWDWDAKSTRPLEQIAEAFRAYDGITAGVVMTTAQSCTASFEKARQSLERELHIPIRVILRAELLRLVLRHIPQIVAGLRDSEDE